MAKKIAQIDGLKNVLPVIEKKSGDVVEFEYYNPNNESNKNPVIDHNTVCFVKATSDDIERKILIDGVFYPINVNDKYIIHQKDVYNSSVVGGGGSGTRGSGYFHTEDIYDEDINKEMSVVIADLSNAGMLVGDFIISEDYTIWYLKDAYTLVNKGNIMGAQGVTGIQGVTGLQGSKYFIDLSSLYDDNIHEIINDSYGANPGDFVISLNGTLWIWNGSSWNEEGVLTGPQGVTGIQGTTGAQGLRGLHICGNLDSSQSLVQEQYDDPTYTPEYNDAFIIKGSNNSVDTDGDIWVYDGETWDCVASLSSVLKAGNNINISDNTITARGYSYGNNVMTLSNAQMSNGATFYFKEGTKLTSSYSGFEIIDTPISISNTNSSSKIILKDVQVESNSSISSSQGFYETSDIRKKNVLSDLSLEKAYDLIDNCQTILYTLKDNSDKKQIGLIAQEVQEFFPEIINTDEEGYLSIDYSKLSVILFKVLKDLIARVSALENK